MAVTRRVGVAQDPRFERHRGPPGHPERPERLAAVAKAVEERSARLVRIEPRPADDAEILRVHGAEHLAVLEEAARRAPMRLDPDTYVSRESAEIARLAAGTAVEANGGAPVAATIPVSPESRRTVRKISGLFLVDALAGRVSEFLCVRRSETFPSYTTSLVNLSS